MKTSMQMYTVLIDIIHFFANIFKPKLTNILKMSYMIALLHDFSNLLSRGNLFVRNKNSILLLLLLTVFCPFLNAQEDTADKETIARMENIVSKLPKISGFVNVRYRYDDSNDANSFDIRRARFDLRGDISKQFGYRLQIEFANGPKILDAYVQWKINTFLSLQAGQYKIPFSFENPYSPTNLETIDNSMVITALSGYSDVSGISANGRDVGLNFSGNFFRREGFSIIQYSVGMFNGSGINSADRNKSKDFSGMVTVNPFRYLALAAYHYNGSAVMVEGGIDNNRQRVRTGFGAKYDDSRWLVRSEYIQGKTGDLKSEGAYAVLAYFVHPKVQTLVKYDYFRRNLSDIDTRQQDYIVGVNYLPVKNIRVQLNYAYRTSPGRDINYVAMQLMGIF
jgi:hypothetical protein